MLLVMKRLVTYRFGNISMLQEDSTTGNHKKLTVRGHPFKVKLLPPWFDPNAIRNCQLQASIYTLIPTIDVNF